MYSMTNIVGFEPLFDQTLSILFQQLDKRFVETKSVFDLCSWLQYYAYDVMGSLTFSKQYGFLKEGKDVNGILCAVERFMDISAPVRAIPPSPAVILPKQYQREYRWAKYLGWIDFCSKIPSRQVSRKLPDLQFLNWSTIISQNE